MKNRSVEQIRQDFPILSQKIYGKDLVYLDNAATTQKPQTVIDAVKSYYSETNSNIHRGVHYLSQKATTQYEAARDQIQKFMGADSRQEIIFTKGTTDSINLIAQSYGRSILKSGDEILITQMEHHSNIVPWQILAEQTGAKLKFIPITDSGELDLSNIEGLLTSRTKILSVVHISNSLGTINPVKKLADLAHKVGAVIVVDGAQAIQHMPVNVQDLNCDFYAFSGHKIYGPTGIGILYGKKSILNSMPPYQGGGDMIRYVSFEKTTYNELPYKFEAGTPHIAGVIGLGAAIKYVQDLGFEFIHEQESMLLKVATSKLSSIPQVRLIGTSLNKASVAAFIVEGVHPHDIGTILDQEGVAVRAGHHCTQPLMDRFKVPATVRASFSFYNGSAEIDVLISGLKKVLEIFK